MLLLRDIQRDTRGFTEFVPLGFIHPRRGSPQGGARAGASFGEDLIVHALARILLNDHIPNLQVSWVKLGFDGRSPASKQAPMNFSGTLMEESISKAAGADFGESVLPGECEAMIRSIEPRARPSATRLRQQNLCRSPMPTSGLPGGRLAARHAPIGVGY